MASTTDEFITSLKVQGAQKAEELIDRHIKKLEKLLATVEEVNGLTVNTDKLSTSITTTSIPRVSSTFTKGNITDM